MPRSDNGPHVLRPVSVRAARVGGDDAVARSGKYLELVEEPVPVCRGGTTVDIEQDRHLVVTGREVDPPFDLDAVMGDDE